MSILPASHVVRQATHDIDTALVTIPVPVAAYKSAILRVLPTTV